ncbi:facilitated trehalose transporter Tret1-like [Ostrinia nubilalis]|uniref:facilitated trehalose transporter Tret1-like n=1 Tax=Ostrinia nubilalis TaxID=29057 RepID=UPI0030825EB0
MEGPKLKSSAVGVQSLATLCLAFFASQTGFICAWPSYTLANFTSNSTVLSRPMTSLEVSLFGAVANIGGLVASPFCGYIFNKVGRKYATVLFGLPYVFAWLIIAFSKSVTMILLAMGLVGVGIAGQNVSLIFISEISHDSIRGGLTASSATGYFIGLLVSYFLGGYLTYYQVVYTHLGLSILCIVLLLLLKESPVYLMLAGREEEAAKSIAFYNQVAVDSKLVEVEMRRIRLQLDPRLEKLLETENTDLEATEAMLQNKIDNMPRKEPSWKILRKSKSSKRALATVLIIIACTIMMGSVVLQVYAEPLFKEAVPSMSANLCSIMLAVDLLIASVVCVLVIDKFGRKYLLIITSALSGVCTFLLGVQLQVHFAPHWVTAFLIYLYTFVYTVGCAVIPFVLAAEVFLPEVRSLCNSLSMGFVWLFMFITLFIFNPLVEILGLGSVFYLFSAVCFLGTVYVYFKLPETKGLSADAIQVLFLKNK